MPELKKPATATIPKVKIDPRPVVYPRVEVYTMEGANAFTIETAQRLLGWEQEEEGGKTFGDSYLFILPAGHDGAGKKVRCKNNTRNRPLTLSWAETLAQDILNRNWADAQNGGTTRYVLADEADAGDLELGPDRTLDLPDETLNGETIIVGRHGQVLSGQHRLIGLILAVLKWRADVEGGHWRNKWPTEPTIEGVLVVGVAEGGRTTRTLDNVKPRTLADVLFCESGFFSDRKLSSADRAKLCKIADFAVKHLWDRTGAKDDPFSPHRTHSESLEFIDRHGKILKSVRHLFTEDKGGVLSAARLSVGKGEEKKTFPNPVQVALGWASAVMYLEAVSASDPVRYAEGGDGVPHERRLDFSRWAKAEEFWSLVAGRSPSLKGLFAALEQFKDPDTGENYITKIEKEAIYAKAWALWAAGKPVTEAACRLNPETDYVQNVETGVRSLVAIPTFGGIDRGSGAKIAKPEDDGDDKEPTPEEVEARKADIEKQRAEEEARRKEMKKKADTAAGPESKVTKASTPADKTRTAKGGAKADKDAAAEGNGKPAKKMTPAEALRAKQRAEAAEADRVAKAMADAEDDSSDEMTLEEELAATPD